MSSTAFDFLPAWSAALADRYLHDDDRLLPRFRRGAGTATSGTTRSSEPVYSTESGPIAKAPGDPYALRGIPLMSEASAGATQLGTHPEEMNVGWALQNETELPGRRIRRTRKSDDA